MSAIGWECSDQVAPPFASLNEQNLPNEAHKSSLLIVRTEHIITPFGVVSDTRIFQHIAEFFELRCHHRRGPDRSRSLPWLSCVSVRNAPVHCLRLWCSPRYQRISPLHREFHAPLAPSSYTVSSARRGLSPRILRKTNVAASTPFTSRRTSSTTRRRSVRLSPIAEDSRLRPPVGVWAVSQSHRWGSASQLP